MVRDTIKAPWNLGKNVRNYIWQQQYNRNNSSWLNNLQQTRGNPSFQQNTMNSRCLLCGRPNDATSLPYIENGAPHGAFHQACAMRVGGMSNTPMSNSKSMEKEPVSKFSVEVVIDPRSLPDDFLQEFGDEDSLFDFLESLSEQECSIINANKDDIETLRQFRDFIVSDLDETSKDLAME